MQRQPNMQRQPTFVVPDTKSGQLPWTRNSIEAMKLLELIRDGSIPNKMLPANVKLENYELFGAFSQTSFRSGLKHARDVVSGRAPDLMAAPTRK